LFPKTLNLSVKVVFWTLSIAYISIKLRFGSWIFFCLQVKKEGQKHLLLGSKKPFLQIIMHHHQNLQTSPLIYVLPLMCETKLYTYTNKR
jgi:hypothetical protein